MLVRSSATIATVNQPLHNCDHCPPTPTTHIHGTRILETIDHSDYDISTFCNWIPSCGSTSALDILSAWAFWGWRLACLSEFIRMDCIHCTQLMCASGVTTIHSPSDPTRIRVLAYFTDEVISHATRHVPTHFFRNDIIAALCAEICKYRRVRASACRREACSRARACACKRDE